MKKILAMANRPKKPITKNGLLKFLAWQMIFLGLASVIAILDFLGVVQRPASVLMSFVFMPFGLSFAAYLQIREQGLEHDKSEF